MSWKARKMVPGKDTIRVMATHYGLKPSVVRDIIRKAGAPVIREDGFKSKISFIRTSDAYGVGWGDGRVGVDVMTTRLTRPAINAVAMYAFRKLVESQADN